jgi:hypothetical protein
MVRNFTSVTKLYGMDNNVEAYVIVENGKTSYVPLDEANTDYQAIQEWANIEGNNIIDPGA